MQKAVGFVKAKCSCNICLTLVCSCVNAKRLINQGGMVLRFFCGLAINLMPVLRKNEGERLCDSENVYITQKVIIACNSGHTPPRLPPGEGAGSAHHQPGGRETESKSASFAPQARSVIAFVLSASLMQILKAPQA